MRYRKFDDTYAVRIDKGEEITAKLKELCLAENIRFAQVSAIGASEFALLGVYNLETQKYAEEPFSHFCEIAGLTGNITTVDGQPYTHLHATLADPRHNLHAGHVLALTVGATCEMFVRVFDSEVGRVHDDQLGINLWDI